jgi:hypothetical protein
MKKNSHLSPVLMFLFLMIIFLSLSSCSSMNGNSTLLSSGYRVSTGSVSPKTKIFLIAGSRQAANFAQEVIDQINLCQENSTFIPALGLLFARRQIEIPVAHAPRSAGRTKYSFYRLIRLNFDLMTGFSVVPLQLFTLLGFGVAGGGLVFGIYLLIRRFLLLRHSEAEGVFTLFALAFFVMGVLMAGLGIVGEYIGRIYQEVRGRPRFLVRKIYGGTAQEARQVELKL